MPFTYFGPSLANKTERPALPWMLMLFYSKGDYLKNHSCHRSGGFVMGWQDNNTSHRREEGRGPRDGPLINSDKSRLDRHLQLRGENWFGHTSDLHAQADEE